MNSAKRLLVSIFAFALLYAAVGNAQQTSTAAPVVPRLMNFTGKAVDAQGKAISGVAGVTFSIYKDETSNVPLWMETQNIQADSKGNYTVQLGATKPAGLPSELFISGEARWLGIRVNGGEEMARTLLLSVPYALKALDAETLGGKPVSAFLQASPSGSASHPSGSITPATEQANEIVCAGSTACKAGFVPKFTTTGGSSKVTSSIISQSGTTINVAGSQALSGSQTIAGSQTVSGNISVANLTATGNVGASTMSTVNPTGGVSSVMTGTGNSISAITGVASATGASGFTFGVMGQSNSDSGHGVFGLSNGASGVGVIGESSGASGIGVIGKALPGSSSYGVYGESFGSNAVSDGVHGVAHGPASGVAGVNDGATGVGVYGVGNGFGVYGISGTASGIGVGAYNTSTGDGLFAYNQSGGFAAFFLGDVDVDGNLSKAGGSFKIDHPLDPANKFLYHSFVESPDMMNIYNGNVTTDAQGSAVVALPDWFESLNRDFRYQLTVIGQFAQAMVSSEINNRQFTIKTDRPNVKVSWQVTGIRQDGWANAHRIPVEQMKPREQRGFYLHPELFGAGAEKSIANARHPELLKHMNSAVSHPPAVQ